MMADAAATAYVLWKRDLMRFFRQPGRVVGALGQPLIFLLVFGAGFGGSFAVPGAPQLSYGAFFFPGVVAMTLLFAAIFSTVSVIEDRREGFLQAILAGPAPRGAVAVGKILGGASLAMIQAGLVLALAPLVNLAPPGSAAGAGGMVGLGWVVAIMAATAVALTALSFSLAWFMASTQGYHAVMSVLLIPLWLVSGAMFPVATAHGWLAWVMRANPLTYAVDGMRQGLWGPEVASAASGLHIAVAHETLLVALAAVGLCAVAVRVTRRAG